jgi:hypothetical protein
MTELRSVLLCVRSRNTSRFFGHVSQRIESSHHILTYVSHLVAVILSGVSEEIEQMCRVDGSSWTARAPIVPACLETVWHPLVALGIMESELPRSVRKISFRGRFCLFPLRPVSDGSHVRPECKLLRKQLMQMRNLCSVSLQRRTCSTFSASTSSGIKQMHHAL